MMATSSRSNFVKICCYYHPEAALVEDYRASDIIFIICSECGLVVDDRVIDVSSELKTVSNDNLRGKRVRFKAVQICCPRHPEAALIEDHRAGDMICPECGKVVGNRVIDVGSEWRNFGDARDDPSRVGAAENPLLDGCGLSTVIGTSVGASGYDESGAPKYHSRQMMSGSDRALVRAFQEIKNMADKINLSKSIVDRACKLFKEVHSSKRLRGRSHDAIATSCLYIACRQEGVPRTFKEICFISRVPKRDIGRCFQLILKAIETNVEVITTGDFMSRFCARLFLPFTVQRAATHIALKAVDMDIVAGRSPLSVAAAAIYMASQASDTKKTQQEIGDVTGVADVTIKKSYQLMLPYSKELFPKAYLFHSLISKLPQA